MMQPLALVLYEQLLPGTQLLNRLRDLGYRVQSCTDAYAILTLARQEKPIILLADLRFRDADICAILRELKAHAETAHIPVIAFADPGQERVQAAAAEAGPTLIAGSDGILDQLEALLQQALHVE
jgi:PleD family two-component response regulator